MVFSILPEQLVLRKDEDETTEAYSSVSCAILMLQQLGLFGLSSVTESGNEEEAITVNSSSCSAMSVLLFLGLFALLSFLRRSEEEEAITTNSLSC